MPPGDAEPVGRVTVSFCQMVGQPLGEVYGPVPASGAPEAEHQVGKSALKIVLDMHVGQGGGVPGKFLRLGISLQVLDDRAVQSRQPPVLRQPPRIGYSAAVQDIPSAVAALILGYSLFI